MTTADLLMGRLSLLQGYIAELGQICPTTPEQYLADNMLKRATERTLQLAWVAGMDISRRIASAYLPRGCVDSSDVFGVLVDLGIISAELASRLVPVAELRNPLVHGYALDDRQVFCVLQNGLGDLARFAEAVARYVGL